MRLGNARGLRKLHREADFLVTYRRILRTVAHAFGQIDAIPFIIDFAAVLHFAFEDIADLIEDMPVARRGALGRGDVDRRANTDSPLPVKKAEVLASSPSYSMPRITPSRFITPDHDGMSQRTIHSAGLDSP